MLENLKDAFLYPQDEYTPIPFWFWNDALTETELIRQIHDFNEKGVKGFVIHPRIGIPKEIEYLSDRFMELVTCAVLEADKLGMKVVLYDEAMYPSGSAHGMVVAKNPEYASKALKMTEHKCSGSLTLTLSEEEIKKLVSVQAVKKASEHEIIPDSMVKLTISKNEIHFTPETDDDWSVLLFSETFTNGHIRGIHFGEDDNEIAPPASSDLLNLAAMEEFINLTHERYYEVLHKFFGNTIIGMFTDEPCIMGRGDMKGLNPWTSNFLGYYINHGNSELDLPYLWFEAGEISSIKKRRYEETVNKRMEESYYKPIYEWCENHHIALTGHPHNSDDIGFLKYFHMPSQDVVWRWVAPENGLALEGEHSTMAKCSSDSARHRSKRRNGNECFACCGKDNIEWAFSADDMKWYMDWLFVRGVNLLFPHAFFYSIDGPRRFGERPPDVGPNNIWWPHYNKISAYIKRMSYLMTDSVNFAQVAVLCGAYHLPWQCVKPLYEEQIEFNYLENELFVSKACVIKDATIQIEKQSYKVLLIEDYQLVSLENKDKIQHFIQQGGSVIIYNPNNIDLGIQNCTYVTSYSDIVNQIDDVISCDVVTSEAAKDLRISHITKNNFDFYVFVNEGEEEINTSIKLYTKGAIEIWDAWNGVIQEADILLNVEDNYIDLALNVKRRESLIILVDTSKSPNITSASASTSVLTSTSTSALAASSREYNKETLLLSEGWFMGQKLENLEKIDVLKPWNEVKDLEHYSGAMFYQNTFTLTDIDAFQKSILNLGEVYEIAQVTLNGKIVDVQMWSPFLFDVTNYLKEGENVLLIEVKNTLANRICNVSLISGLIGPVNLNFSNVR